jgi:hypothetical protein
MNRPRDDMLISFKKSICQFFFDRLIYLHKLVSDCLTIQGSMFHLKSFFLRKNDNLTFKNAELLKLIDFF